MSLIEQAAQRLEALRQAGVEVPWAAAGITEEAVRRMARADAAAAPPVDGFLVERQGAPQAAPVGLPVEGVPPGLVLPFSGGSRPAARVQVDLDHLAAEGCLVPSQSPSALAAGFRQLKQPLLTHAASSGAPGEPPRHWVMVTSAQPADGRTFCAVNLAMSIAIDGEAPVLLVDADPGPQGVLAKLGVGPGPYPGLFDALADPAQVCGDLLLRTDIPRLTLLPAGQPPAQRDEWLASARMEELLSELSRAHPDHIILVDAPALSASPHAPALAAKMGQVVVVVAAARTALQKARQAFDSLNFCPLVLPVLNERPEPFQRTALGHRHG